MNWLVGKLWNMPYSKGGSSNPRETQCLLLLVPIR
jgi:hypothetical protein